MPALRLSDPVYAGLAPINVVSNRTALALKGPHIAGEPRFFVSLSTLPTRSPIKTLDSLLHWQTRAPEVVLVVAPRVFIRFPGRTVNLTDVRAAFPADANRLETRYCEADYGPGSKLLCALPPLRARMLHDTRGGEWALVVVDDDRMYRGWTIRGVNEAMRVLPFRRHAYSYKSWRVALPRGLAPLRLLQGSDLFAMPAADLFAGGGIRRFFDCAVALSETYKWHDDFWTSAYLQFVRNLTLVELPVNYSGKSHFDHHCWRKVVSGAGDGMRFVSNTIGSGGHTTPSEKRRVSANVSEISHVRLAIPTRAEVERETAHFLPLALQRCVGA